MNLKNHNLCKVFCFVEPESRPALGTLEKSACTEEIHFGLFTCALNYLYLNIFTGTFFRKFGFSKRLGCIFSSEKLNGLQSASECRKQDTH